MRGLVLYHKLQAADNTGGDDNRLALSCSDRFWVCGKTVISSHLTHLISPQSLYRVFLDVTMEKKGRGSVRCRTGLNMARGKEGDEREAYANTTI